MAIQAELVHGGECRIKHQKIIIFVFSRTQNLVTATGSCGKK
jgi:hypothetical protein